MGFAALMKLLHFSFKKSVRSVFFNEMVLTDDITEKYTVYNVIYNQRALKKDVYIKIILYGQLINFTYRYMNFKESSLQTSNEIEYHNTSLKAFKSEKIRMISYYETPMRRLNLMSRCILN
jgi:hypothetical protein